METNTTTHATPEVSGGGTQGTARTTVRIAAAGVALVLIATLAWIGASPASADPPPTSNFVPKSVAPGESSYADVHCNSDDGEYATVYVSYKGGAEKGYGFLIGSGSGPGTFRIDASSDGDNHVIDTDLLGTWDVRVECPSYTPLLLELHVTWPTLDVVTRLDLDNSCATVDDLSQIKVGSENIVCFTITNHTGKDIRRLHVANGGNVNGGTMAPGELPDGGSWDTWAGDARWLDPAGETLTNLSAWAEFEVAPGVTQYASSTAQSIVVPPAGPALDLQATVSTWDTNSCANSGGSDAIAVTAGTDVWVCYQMTNLSKTDIDLHYLSSTALGTLLEADAYELSPGAYRSYLVKLNPTEDIDLTATWTGAITSHKVSFDATDGATIDVEGADAPVKDDEPEPEAEPEETTTTTAPAKGPVDDPADQPADDDDAAPNKGDAPTTTVTEVEAVDLLAISAQPKYAG